MLLAAAVVLQQFSFNEGGLSVVQMIVTRVGCIYSSPLLKWAGGVEDGFPGYPEG